jgi:hypothetical protein
MPLLDPDQIRTTRSIQKCNKIYIVKIGPVCWTFLPICNTMCCIRSPAWPTYSTPNGTRVLTLGCNILGFPWRKRAAVPALHTCSDLAVPNQGLRRGAFATRHKPLDRQALPTDRRQLKTCDSRADETSSFQPLLLGSHDGIIMPVHGTSV